MEIIIRTRREMKEAEELGIAHVARTVFRLRLTAFYLCIGYGILWFIAHQ